MYDDFDDYFYPAEDDYHEALLEMEARENFYSESEVDDDDDLENLLDELDYPFWRKSLSRNDLGRRGRAATDVTPLIPTTYDDSK